MRAQRQALHLHRPQGQAGRRLESPAQVRLRDVVLCSPVLTPSVQTHHSRAPCRWCGALKPPRCPKQPTARGRAVGPPCGSTPSGCRWLLMNQQRSAAVPRSSGAIVPLPQPLGDPLTRRCCPRAPGAAQPLLRGPVPPATPPLAPPSSPQPRALSDSGAGLRPAASVSGLTSKPKELKPHALRAGPCFTGR